MCVCLHLVGTSSDRFFSCVCVCKPATYSATPFLSVYGSLVFSDAVFVCGGCVFSDGRFCVRQSYDQRWSFFVWVWLRVLGHLAARARAALVARVISQKLN